MLESVSEEIRNCYAHAETCARQAAEQTDPKLREDFLALKAAWLKLARLRETDLSDRIRERAYEIWIASGYRSGEAEQHWLAAEREILSALEREILSALQSTKRCFALEEERGGNWRGSGGTVPSVKEAKPSL